MKAYAYLGLIIAMLAALVVMISYGEKDNSRKQKACEDQGGTWFFHEHRCLDIRTIPVQ